MYEKDIIIKQLLDSGVRFIRTSFNLWLTTFGMGGQKHMFSILYLNDPYFVSSSALEEGSIEFVLKMKNIRNAFRVYFEN